MKLANKIAIVTGGGTGIGEGISHLFAREGARVVIAQRTAETGEKTVAAIGAAGGQATFIRTDVTRASEVRNLIAKTVTTYGKMDILVNNAGIVPSTANIEDIEETVWDEVYAINVKGVFLTTKYAVSEMKKTGGGAIVFIASMSAVKPRPRHADYCSSKAAVVGLAKSLALELAPYKIRCNCVNPATTDVQRLRKQAAETIGWDAYRQKYASEIPLGRIALPQDIAYAALYLASDEAAMVTGMCINVDGGRGL